MSQEIVRLVGNFTGSGYSELLFYYPESGEWWLGYFSNNQFHLRLANNSAGFGNLLEGHQIWVGNFTGSQQLDLLFYYPRDGNWWLGRFTETQLNWKLVGNTAGFGNLTKNHLFWVAKFLEAEQINLLFYTPADGNWWVGSLAEEQLNWKLAGNTAGFGNLADGRPFWTGNFTDSSRTDILFFSPADNHWWLGYFVGTQLQWNLVNSPDQPDS
jgi:hypothetical protein